MSQVVDVQEVKAVPEAQEVPSTEPQPVEEAQEVPSTESQSVEETPSDSGLDDSQEELDEEAPASAGDGKPREPIVPKIACAADALYQLICKRQQSFNEGRFLFRGMFNRVYLAATAEGLLPSYPIQLGPTTALGDSEKEVDKILAELNEFTKSKARYNILLEKLFLFGHARGWFTGPCIVHGKSDGGSRSRGSRRGARGPSARAGSGGPGCHKANGSSSSSPNNSSSSSGSRGDPSHRGGRRNTRGPSTIVESSGCTYYRSNGSRLTANDSSSSSGPSSASSPDGSKKSPSHRGRGRGRDAH